MRYLKKISLSKRQKKSPPRKKQIKDSGKGEDLMGLIWEFTQDLSRKHQENAKYIVERFQANPNAGFNGNKELVYKNMVLGGSNVINLIRQLARGSRRRILMPGSSVFRKILDEGPTTFNLPHKHYAKKTRKGGYSEYVW